MEFFQISKSKKNKTFQKTILSLIFKFQAQDSFWNIFFLRFGDLKNELHFLKKATFRILTLHFIERIERVFYTEVVQSGIISEHY